MIKLSVIIPVYNCEKYLSNCIDSLVANFVEGMEVILVDDGSRDSSGDICDIYARNYNYIKVIHQKNSGVSVARNRGILAAEGEFLMFVDSDDYMEEMAISSMLSKMIPGVDLVATGIKYWFDYNDNYKVYNLPNADIDMKVEVNSYFVTLNDNRFFSAIYSKVYRTDIIKENNIKFPTEYSIWEDSAFVYTYLSHCEKIRCLDMAVYVYRQTLGESLVKKANENAVEALIYRYTASKYLIEILSSENLNLYFSSLKYWLYQSFRQLYRCKNKLTYRQIVEKYDNKNVLEIIRANGKCNLVKSDYIPYFLLNRKQIALFHLYCCVVARIRKN